VVEEPLAQVGLRHVGALEARAHVPEAALYAAAHACAALSAAFLAKPLALAPFAVRMLTMDRHFDTGKIASALGYAPLVAFEDGWPEAVDAIRARMVAAGERPAGCARNRSAPRPARSCSACSRNQSGDSPWGAS
jgi:hypothetical protein